MLQGFSVVFFLCLQFLVWVSLGATELEYQDAWTNWKRKFNKQYASKVEHTMRFNIFKANMNDINAHNVETGSKSSSVNWRKKMNQFGDMTSQEYKDYARCANFDHDIKYSDQFLTKLESRHVNIKDLENPGSRLSDVPDFVDWTQVDNIVTPVKNQGECGSCWAFGATGNMESRFAIANGELNSLSEQELIDCAGDDSNCNGGYSDMGFIYGMWNYGLSLESDYPYVGTGGHHCRKDAYEHFNSVDGLVEVERYNATALMAAVAEGPVTIGIEASEAFEYYGGGVFDGMCGTDVDHMVLIVGYNSTGEEPYWKIKNSWGDDWGEDGYIRMCMDCDKNGPSGECCVLCYPSVAYFFDS